MSVAAKVIEPQAAAEEVLVLDPETIQPQEGQPREWFDPDELRLLTVSIAQVGQLQPGIVRPVDKEKGSVIEWELVDGERRWRACVTLGRMYRATVRRDYKSKFEQFLESCASNFNRADHHPLEIARAVERMRVEGKMSDVDIGKVFGKSQAWAYQHRRLLQLDPDVRKLMHPRISEDRRLRFTHALELIDLSPKEQLELAQKIVAESMKLIEVRTHVRRMNTNYYKKAPKPSDDFRTLSRFLSTLNLATEPILEMKGDRFNRMLGARSLDERTRAFRQATQAAEDLKLIAQQIERAGLLGLSAEEKRRITGGR
jgi:ParB family chromosome partitioning protein